MLPHDDPQVVWLRDRWPMNEHDAWQNMKPYLDNFGVPTRLENSAAASVPDVLFICGGLMMFIELKVDYSGYFYMPPFQFAYANRIKHHLRPHFHWIAVWNHDNNGFMMFAFQRVLTMPRDTKGHKLRFHWEPVWEKMKTKFLLYSAETYDEWIKAIMKLEFE